jgi:methionyl-tRNA synthetase
MERFAFAQALENVWRLIHFANRYIDKQSPWKVARENDAALDKILYRLLDCSRILAIFLFPFMPSTARRLWELLGMKESLVTVSRIAELEWGKGPECYETRPPEPLFPRLV